MIFVVVGINFCQLSLWVGVCAYLLSGDIVTFDID